MLFLYITYFLNENARSHRDFLSVGEDSSKSRLDLDLDLKCFLNRVARKITVTVSIIYPKRFYTGYSN